MSQLNTADFFDSYAEGFDAIYGTKNNLFNNMVNKLFRKTMKVRFEKTIAGCSPIKDKSVLDIGCGPGHYGIILARQGASRVLGLDFAKGMLDVANKNAKAAGVANQCEFVLGDFLTYDFQEKFDYSILMGFMDYIENPGAVVDKALSITNNKAFFSFPVSSGFLAWQRKIRYKNRCDLYLYTHEQVQKLFLHHKLSEVSIEKIGRDFFVTASL